VSEGRTSIPTHRSSADAIGQSVLPAQRNRTSSTPLVQALREARGDVDTNSVNQVVQSAGETLDGQSRQFFESRFGHDFSRVRVHADQRAGESADCLQAEAYTAGTHVVFAPGRYEPQTERGRSLLAHELAHVTQQSGWAGIGGPMRLSRPNSPEERSADFSVHRVAAGLAPALSQKAESGVIYRTIKDDLRKAIAGWGTDEEAIYTRLTNASAEEKTAVLSDPILMQDLYDDLSRGEWGRVLGLLGAGAESRIHAASEGWGTDEEGIYDALRATGVEALKGMLQGATVLLELRDELDDDELGEALSIIAGKFHREGINATADAYHSLVLFPDVVDEAMDHLKSQGLDVARHIVTSLPRGHNMPPTVVDDVNTHIANDNDLARVQAAFGARWNLNLTARAKPGGSPPRWTVGLIRNVHRALQQLPPGHVVRAAQDTAGIVSGEVAAFQLDAQKPNQGSWNAASGTIRVGTEFGSVAGLTRHEVGHAMDDFLGATTVAFKQNATNGWSWGASSTTWETAMAAPWRRKDGTQVPAVAQLAIKTVLDAYVQTNGKGGLRAGTAAAHAIRTYWNDDVPIIEAAKSLAGKGDDVYTDLGSVKKIGGRYYSWSTYYHEFYVYNAIVQDKRVTNYSLYGHPEFFAEMYEVYYEGGAGAKRGEKLKGVPNWKQFFDTTVHPTVMT
jgi:hypothetical protein